MCSITVSKVLAYTHGFLCAFLYIKKGRKNGFLLKVWKHFFTQRKVSIPGRNGGKYKFLIMPSKIVANEGVGMNLPVYDFNAFLGHYRAFYGLFAGRKNWQIVKFNHPI